MKTILKVFSLDMTAKLISVVTTVLLIRNMETSAYANYTIMVAATNVFSQIAISSFGKIYIVDYKDIKDKESSLFLIEVILALMISVAFYIIQPDIRYNIVGLFALLISTCIFSFARILYQQQCRFGIYCALEIIRAVVFICSIVVLYYIKGNELTLFIVVLAQTFSLMAVAPFLFIKSCGEIWKKKIQIRAIFNVIFREEQLYLLIYAILMSILLQIDVMTLKKFSSDYYVSAYSSALKYYNVMLMIMTTVNSVLLPKISMENEYKKIKKMYAQQDVLSMFLLAGVVIAIIAAPYVLPYIDGGKYPEAISVFRILCISAFVSFVGSPYNNLLIKEKKYFSMCLRFSIGILVSIVGNWLIIPKYNAMGTAFVTLLSYGFVNLSSRVEANFIINNKIKEQENNA